MVWLAAYEDVEEMLSDTVHRFVAQVPQDCACPEAYFHKIFFRVALDQLRRNRAQCRIPAALLEPIGSPGEDSPDAHLAAPAASSDPLEILMQREKPRHVLHLVRTASKGRAEVAQLFAKGHTHAEIAATLGISNGAVRDRLICLRKMLRASFKDDVK